MGKQKKTEPNSEPKKAEGMGERGIHFEESEPDVTTVIN
jgi:hypothetical protein